ncbi:hypothetical protein [Anaerosporobacter faecicola]|uniref:hypothetical protein n=1 Tax=Anaerosporobacter faecicola TaxID=2718714 RepID=UPI001438F0BE|nr:hypothetical protein [Anaerosporobacter faecicola]
MEENKKNGKMKGLQNKAGKYLVIFVVCMIALTIVSRISASLTVPIVSTQVPKKDVLNYKITGEGVIDSANAIYLDLVKNLQISEVYVKKGQNVKEGDPLFCYDLNQLNDTIEEAQKAYDAAQRAYDKAVLQESLEEDNKDTNAEQKAVKRANEDLKDAQKEYEKAKEVYKEKIQEIKDSLTETQKKEYDAAQEEYDTAKEAYEETKAKNAKAVADAKEAYSDAQTERDDAIAEAKAVYADAQSDLDEVTEKQTKLLKYMATFEQHAKSQKYTEMDKDLENIYITYFGKSEYEQIKAKVDEAQDTLNQAEDNLKSVKKKWELTMEEADRELAKVDPSSDEYSTALNKYKLQQIEKEDAIDEAQDAVNSAKKQVANVSPKYTEITDAAIAYFYFLAANPTGSDTTLHKKYYTAIIDSSVIDEAEYKRKNKAVEKAKAAVTTVTKKQDKLVAKAKAAVEEAVANQTKELEKAKAVVTKKAKAVDVLLDKVYEDKEGIRAARESLDMKEDAVDKAKRQVEDAMDTLSDTERANAMKEQNDRINAQIAALDKEQLQEEMETKEEVLEELEQVQKAKGNVVADLDGMVTALDIEPRGTISGSEKVAITPSCAVFVGNFEKDYKEYVEIGDEVSCKLTGYKDPVKGEVLTCTYNSEIDGYEFTAKLAEEEYAPGISGEFTISKASEKYDCCIPLTALRNDNAGDYVLVMREASTILGKEYKAYRVNVTVSKKDFQTAVINDVLAYDDEVIIGSNRNVMEGDRVRKGTYE